MCSQALSADYVDVDVGASLRVAGSFIRAQGAVASNQSGKGTQWFGLRTPGSHLLVSVAQPGMQLVGKDLISPEVAARVMGALLRPVLVGLTLEQLTPVRFTRRQGVVDAIWQARLSGALGVALQQGMDLKVLAL